MNNPLQRATHAILRIGTGLLFLEHGFQKFGFLGGLGGPCCAWNATGPTAAAIGLTRLQVAGWMELVGGALLIAGFLTRPVAAVLLVEMVVAFFLAHFPRGGSRPSPVGTRRQVVWRIRLQTGTMTSTVSLTRPMGWPLQRIRPCSG